MSQQALGFGAVMVWLVLFVYEDRWWWYVAFLLAALGCIHFTTYRCGYPNLCP